MPPDGFAILPRDSGIAMDLPNEYAIVFQGTLVSLASVVTSDRGLRQLASRSFQW